MIWGQMPDERGVDVALRYKGPDVESGMMPIDDVVSALHGFAGAYGKIASQHDPDTEHQLRVVALKTESFELAIAAWVLLSDPSGQTKLVDIAVKAVKASRWIVETIAKLIEVKKVSNGKPFDVKVDGKNNTVVLVSVEGSTVSMTPDQYKIVESKMVDSDLDRIADPLRPNHIEKVELTITDGTDKIADTEIPSSDREYFRPEETVVTTSRETEIRGTLVSLNKETNRGSFRLVDGKRVPYRYSGTEELRFHLDFSYRGPVLVKCVANLDESLNVKQLDIKAVDRLQGSLLPE